MKAAFAEKAVTSKQNTKPILKRRVGYADEEVSFTHSKLAQMDIDGNRGDPEKGNKEDNLNINHLD